MSSIVPNQEPITPSWEAIQQLDITVTPIEVSSVEVEAMTVPFFPETPAAKIAVGACGVIVGIGVGFEAGYFAAFGNTKIGAACIALGLAADIPSLASLAMGFKSFTRAKETRQS